MRIISGKLKGKKILIPKDKTTRPLKDLVKESIFNIINHSNKFDTKIDNSIILDLFSGVGSFGLEAISRGATNIVFVENYIKVLPILKKNIKSLNLEDKCEIFEEDIFEDFNFKDLGKKFDIIFLDPPFKNENKNLLITKIFKSKILNKEGIIIMHKNYKEKDNFPLNFHILEKKKYGNSKIIFGNFT